MSKRHKNFRQQNHGLSPYMIWILTGACLNYKIVASEKKNRLNMVDRHGVIKTAIHNGAIKSLVNKNLLAFSKDLGFYILTDGGFEIASQRLEKSKAIIVKTGKTGFGVTNKGTKNNENNTVQS